MTIIVGYTPSPQSDAALDRALLEARIHGTDLVVLNVSRGEALVETKRLYDEPAADLVRRLDESGVPFAVRREVVPSPAAEAILEVVEELRPELLVIGLRRRSATGKLLFGSTAQRILLDAPCDVLSVKADSEH